MTQYTYNSLGLLEGTSWTVPPGSNIPVTAAVSLAYDAVGNRTSMTDGLGTAVYEYDELSRMTAETRNFTDALPNAPLPGNGFRLEYAYTLGGGLKSLTDPFGQQFNYGYDKQAGLQSITGSTTFAGVTQYLSSVKRRAWGVAGEVNYGNGVRMNAGADIRLQASDLTLTNISTGTVLMDIEYQYRADGKLSYSGNALNPKYDRLFKYDFGSRLGSVRTGAEARGQTETDPTQIPFREDFENNSFGQLTERSGDWKPGTNCEITTGFDFVNAYQNNRNTGSGWTYDADGRNLHGKSVHKVYDARGETVKNFSGGGEFDFDIKFDANGGEVKRTETLWDEAAQQYTDPRSKYYLRSSILGGAVVTELAQSGAKATTFIFAGGQAIAQQEVGLESGSSDKVLWEHWDASRNSRLFTTASGTAGQRAELDPMGSNAEYICFPTFPDRGQWTLSYERTAIQPFPEGTLEYGQWCYVDGIPMACEQAWSFLSRSTEAIADITFLDDLNGVFSDLAGRTELGDLELMRDGLQAGNDDSSVETEKGLNGTSDSFVTVQAGPPAYKIVQEKVRLGNKVQDQPQQKEPNFVGISDDRKTRLLELLDFALNEDCEKAFKAAGVETIRDQIANGITIVAQNILHNPYDDRRWAPTLEFAKKMREASYAHPYALDVTNNGPYKGGRYTSITNIGFQEKGDFLSVTLIHALIHSGGKEGRNYHTVTGPIYNAKTGMITTERHSIITGAKHDLEYLREAYDAIIAACTPEGYSRIGPTTK